MVSISIKSFYVMIKTTTTTTKIWNANDLVIMETGQFEISQLTDALTIAVKFIKENKIDIDLE